jgi:hypothetical protein
VSFIAEGYHVAYIGSGEPDAPLAYGDEGVVIMAAGPGSHVKWTSGECTDYISLTSNARLQSLEASNEEPESGYTESQAQVHLAVCPRCAGEGFIPEDE